MTISAGKMSGLWTGEPTSVRLDDLDVLCVVLDCQPGDLLKPEPEVVAAQAGSGQTGGLCQGSHCRAAARAEPDAAAGVKQGDPRPCQACGLNRRAKPGGRHCYDCMPGGPFIPPPCQRCGTKENFFASGLCARCHLYGSIRVDACPDCHAWGATRHSKWLCGACLDWRAKFSTIGPCIACGTVLAISDTGVCRLCRVQARRNRNSKAQLDLPGANRHGAQLFLADMYKKCIDRTRPADSSPDPVLAPPSGHRLVLHRQTVLFTMERDFSGGRRMVGPPATRSWPLSSTPMSATTPSESAGIGCG